jgi:hypothetical protein
VECALVSKPRDKHSEWLAEIKAQKGEPPPEDIVPQIQPYPDLIWAWNAFWRLSRKRPQGFNGPLHIPDSEVLARSRLEGWDFTRCQDFAFYLERMDDVYMAHVAKLQKEEEEKRDNKSRSQVPRRR